MKRLKKKNGKKKRKKKSARSKKKLQAANKLNQVKNQHFFHHFTKKSFKRMRKEIIHVKELCMSVFI